MGLGMQSDLVDPHAVLGRVALLLARDAAAALPAALGVVVECAGLRSAVLRRGDELLAAAGERVHAVPDGPLRAPAGTVELEVRDDTSVPVVLTATGVRPSALPLLRDVAVVLRPALAGHDRPGTGARSGSVPAATALLRDADRDRGAVADALHDGPVQDLLAARYAADAALRSPAPDLLAVRAAVQTALVTLRRTMGDLRPRGADGLEPALEGLSSRLTGPGGAGLRLRVDPQADALAPPAAAVAYRLVQAVAPGTSPDGGVRVSLQLGRTPGTALLTVVGGCPLPDSPRWRRAAAALGGDLLVTAGRLHLTLPLADPPAGAARAARGLRVAPALHAGTSTSTSTSTSKAVL